MVAAELRSWLPDPVPEKFPYDAVVRHFRDVGKHFVAPDVVGLLAEVRARLPALRGPWQHVRTLAMFLDTALDKPDERYDYPTYLAISLLQLPTVDEPADLAPFARSRCDRLTAQLVADALAFEIAVLDSTTTALPKMRPSADQVAKRCKHGLRAMWPAIRRQVLDGGLAETGDSVALAREVSSVVRADMSATEQRDMELSALPVYTAHDEYLFLRVLQAFETTFALLAVQLQAVVTALASGDAGAGHAVRLLDGSAGVLAESAPLFSMLATMQVESFRTFRQFTEGASAIQSRNYKIVEALCRRPDPSRLDSAAFLSVPDVRARVLAGQVTLADAVAGVSDVSLDKAMDGFARALRRWRNTHYRLAVRMLGDATGTGYTEGTPYLAAVRSIPVFRP